MSDTKFTQEEIVDYINNQLDSDRVKELELLLSVDESVQDELNFLRASAEIGQESERQRLKKVLNETPKNNYLYFIFSGLIAASIAAFIIFNYQVESSLYSDYYEPLPENVIMRDIEIHPGIQAYSKNDYVEALTLLSEPPLDYTFDIYRGICLMELEDYNEAIEAMSQIDSDNSDFHSAQWYTALCWMALENNSQSMNSLNNIEEDSPYFDQALEILRKMK